MKNNKLVRELVPVIALLLFIIVILILCVVSARGKRASEETETASETVAESTVPEHAAITLVPCWAEMSMPSWVRQSASVSL